MILVLGDGFGGWSSKQCLSIESIGRISQWFELSTRVTAGSNPTTGMMGIFTSILSDYNTRSLRISKENELKWMGL